MKASDISAAIDRETRRQAAVADAARKAAVEVGTLNGLNKGFCELTYIIGSMREAAIAFDTRS